MDAEHDLPDNPDAPLRRPSRRRQPVRGGPDDRDGVATARGARPLGRLRSCWLSSASSAKCTHRRSRPFRHPVRPPLARALAARRRAARTVRCPRTNPHVRVHLRSAGSRRDDAARVPGGRPSCGPQRLGGGVTGGIRGLERAPGASEASRRQVAGRARRTRSNNAQELFSRVITDLSQNLDVTSTVQ